MSDTPWIPRPAAALAALLLLAAPGLWGCAACRLDRLQSAVDADGREVERALDAGADPRHAQQRLVQHAREARGHAEDPRVDAKTRVRFYAIASEAAWQADGVPGNDVLGVVDAGTAACAALPAQDASAPRDCTLIRLARPYAVHQELRPAVEATAKRIDALPAGGRLPAAEGREVEQRFVGLADEVERTGEIHARAVRAKAPPALLQSIDRARGQMYCTMLKSFRALRAVEGATLVGMSEETRRKDEITRALAAAGIDTTCGHAGGPTS